jgi:hypothetical protein
MAESLLAVIDFEDLSTCEYSILVKTILSATQERYSISRVNIDGDSQPFTGAETFARFKYGTNDAKYKFNEGDPVIFNRDLMVDLIENAADDYADLEKIYDEIGSEQIDFIQKRLGLDADDDETYESRLMEVAEEEEYPDFQIISSHDVGIWYNLIKQLTHILRFYTKSSADRVGDYAKLNLIGGFDTTNAGTILTPQGARDYGSDPSVLNTNTTPWTDWKTAHDNLFSGDDTGDAFDQAGTYLPTDPANERYRLRASIGGSNYHVWLKAFSIQYEVDFSGIKDFLGNEGLPLDFARLNIMEIAQNTVATADGWTAASFRENEDEVYEEVLSETWDGDTVKIDIDDGITKAVIPSSLPTTTGQSNDIYVRFGDIHSGFIENWDGEGGFDYFIEPEE